jgi:GNAT superfamily N-acetyltransferase
VRPSKTKRLKKIETAEAKVQIRSGTARDVPAILSLIRGLAKYEHLTHEVRASAKRLRRDGFGAHRYFETLICTCGGSPVGFTLYFFAYSTFGCSPTLYIEDIFVLPEERGKGIGKALLVALARVANRKGCGRMEWAVLDWNAPAIEFYRKLGAKSRKEWILTRLSGPALRRLAAGG